MEDITLLFFTILWALFVSLIISAINYLIGVLYIYGSFFKKMGNIILSPFICGEKRTDDCRAEDLKKILDQILEDYNVVNKKKQGLITYGTDLAAIAITLDFTAYGIWYTNNQSFLFFSKLTTHPNSAWIWIIIIHAILLVISVTLKYVHSEKIGSLAPHQIIDIFNPNERSFKSWAAQNIVMIAAVIVGFLTLLSSFAIFMDTISLVIG